MKKPEGFTEEAQLIEHRIELKLYTRHSNGKTSIKKKCLETFIPLNNGFFVCSIRAMVYYLMYRRVKSVQSA
jgi:hypothetical protein